MQHLTIPLILLVFFIVNTTHAVEPFSIAIGAAALAGLGYNFDFFKEKTYCKFKECCNDEYIPHDIYKLEEELSKRLFGQHIVIQQLVPALQAHFNKGIESKKALVLSFHGTPGTGKNYVADFIARSIYKNGLNSKFVFLFKGRADFPLQSESKHYSNLIKEIVQIAVTACPKSLFIFDEVDKMPDGIFEALTSLVDYHSSIRKTVYNKAIFVFISNTAGVEISSRLGDLMLKGKLREETNVSNFEKILELGAYNLEGGMKKAGLIETHVIDHYIPFLPLQKDHVFKCIEAEFRRWDTFGKDDIIENIIDSHVTFEKEYNLFATSGCKRLDKIVGVAAAKEGL